MLGWLLPAAVPSRASAPIEVRIDADPASYFFRPSLTPGDARGMSRWRKALFVATSRITADAAEYFGLPRERS
jgi:KUP system potassium uptake protein